MFAKSARIFVAGHNGMVGSAIVRALKLKGYSNILTQSHQELDLLDQRAVLNYLKQQCPDYIFIAAAKVGGIHANNVYRAEFIYQNLAIATNLIHGAHLANVERLCFLGSSCIYPRDCLQPIKEEYLLTGSLEQTNEPYAIAKIAGIKLCESYNHQYGRRYISVMPTNLYGPNDNYDLNTSHVLPALIRKVHEAKVSNESFVNVWGTGLPRREFLYVEDLARSCVFLMETDCDDTLLNVGIGQDVTIKDLTRMVIDVVGYDGNIRFDKSKPDGTPRKLLDVSKINALGWKAEINLVEGISLAYKDFLQRYAADC